MSTSCEIALGWMPQKTFDDNQHCFRYWLGTIRQQVTNCVVMPVMLDIYVANKATMVYGQGFFYCYLMPCRPDYSDPLWQANALAPHGDRHQQTATYFPPTFSGSHKFWLPCGDQMNIMFIIDRCRHSSTAMVPVKYKCQKHMLAIEYHVYIW